MAGTLDTLQSCQRLSQQPPTRASEPQTRLPLLTELGLTLEVYFAGKNVGTLKRWPDHMPVTSISPLTGAPHRRH